MNIDNQMIQESAIPKRDVLPYMNYIRTEMSSQNLIVASDIGLTYVGNFYGLLHELEVEPEFWFICLLLNGYQDRSQYDGEEIIRVTRDDKFIQLLRLLRGTGLHDIAQLK